ncbi:bifunctional diguanylate cyclase/phosphodiesterase [uncultured Parasphingorhabdus sp.]|uniref:putative bifunctional diguanylate cyclase/phosphodiesterase n=1 Tax=uncultured Parasphingorhabdus sp. TaxID=2709694 RepID=UPI0030D83E09
MRKYLKQLGGSTQSLVFTPLIVLTLIFGALAVLLVMNDAISIPLTSPLILGGALAFVIAALVFARLGVVYIGHLESLVMTDSLSLLPNRRALHIDVQRNGTHDSELAIALIDLDGFKLVNDQYGHNVGDQVIKNCATMLADLCGDDARCYRLGGDEFAISMTGPLAGTIVEGISRSFIDLFKKPIIVDDRRIVIGASIGISCSKGADRQHSSELLRRSDVAMYTSKRNGKMRCTWYQPEFDRNREVAQKIDGEMRRALSNDEFYVHYQPLVCARTSKIVAVESLLRWARPDGEPMGPDVFIPIAEETGLINPIGLKVLRRACNDALAWDDITLSVNISPAQLRDVEFPIQLGQILEETGFPAERLELEITETCLVLDPVLAERTLDVIRGFGVSIALDDFGTGYASIGFLRMFRFEKLKLDRSLVVDAGEDEGSRAMMISSISVARALDMAVTAEGVETQQQADLARIAGCDYIQGWLYFKAMPPDEITHHLNKQNAQNDQTKLIG